MRFLWIRTVKSLYISRFTIISEKKSEDGQLPGERLPSSRSLSSYLQVSRSTVELAYEQLVSEGYLESIPYRGYFACEMEELYHIEGMQGVGGGPRGTEAGISLGFCCQRN